MSRHLTTLSHNPNSISALMGAGMASLAVGDPQAALTFFARAEEQAPRDGRIKMRIGSSLVQLEQSAAALKFFADAIALGVAEAEVAGDRGLAHDMRGDQRSAQRDYALALRHGRDAEITRRLALSLAISGQREPALQLLEDQLLLRDRAASRTRALVLALTGDTARANEATRATMPAAQASAMAPFLARLPSLSPAERALAVHFGRIPGDGRVQVAQARPQAGILPVSSAVTRAGRPDSRQPAPGVRRADTVPVSTAARRRPGSGEQTASAGPAAGPVPGRTSPSNAVQRPVQVAQAVPKPVAGASVEPSPSAGPRQTAQPAPAGGQRAQTALPAGQPAAAGPRPEPGPGLAEVAALVAALPANDSPAGTAPAKAPSTRPVAAPAAAQPRVSAASTARPAATRTGPQVVRELSRHWVQIAGGADKRALPREFTRLKGKAPSVFGARTAWTTPLGATNRLLVGPFPSAKAAQDFVNALAGAALSAFGWTSPAGQAIEKLPAR